MQIELLPSILISELQVVDTSSMVLLQELLFYIAEIYNQQEYYIQLVST